MPNTAGVRCSGCGRQLSDGTNDVYRKVHIAARTRIRGASSQSSYGPGFAFPLSPLCAAHPSAVFGQNLWADRLPSPSHDREALAFTPARS